MRLIQLSNIWKTYPLGDGEVPVLKGINLEITEGDYVALVGTSGSGKTTLMNIIGCLDKPSQGEFLLAGQKVHTMSPDERARVRSLTIGFVFQNFNLLPRTTATENVRMPLLYRELPLQPEEEIERATKLLNLLGLGSRLEHVPSQLSGGQQQRVAIARALVNSPKLLLADEPTGNLDSTTTAEILSVFRTLNSEQGLTIILVTHDHEVAQHASRRIRMKDGLIEDEE